MASGRYQGTSVAFCLWPDLVGPLLLAATPDPGAGRYRSWSASGLLLSRAVRGPPDRLAALAQGEPTPRSVALVPLPRAGGVVVDGAWSEPACMEWYVHAPGAEAPIGPLSTELIVQGLQAGKVHPGANVCAAGASEWQPITRIPEFGAAVLGVAPPSPAPVAQQEQAKSGGCLIPLLLGGAVLFALAWIGDEMLRPAKVTASDAPGQTTTVSPATAGNSPNIGDEVTLRMPASDSRVFVFATEESYDASVKAAAAKDRDGYDEAAASAYRVDAGTKALLIARSGLFSYKVRIKEGPHAGKAGFLPKEFVQK